MRVMGAQRKGAKSKFKESSKVGFRKLQISRDLRQKRKGDDRGWDGWMASPTRWTWVCVNSGVGDGQGGLVCCDSWSCKESDTTERLNWRQKTSQRWHGECEDRALEREKNRGTGKVMGKRKGKKFRKLFRKIERLKRTLHQGKKFRMWQEKLAWMNGAEPWKSCWIIFTFLLFALY